LGTRIIDLLGSRGLQSPNPLPRLIRTGLGQYRVLQVGDASFNTFDEAVVGPSVDILYQYEDLDNVGWAPQIPFVGVAPIPMQTWKLGGSNHLSYRGGSVTTFFFRNGRQ
jgi:hypothetical protein